MTGGKQSFGSGGYFGSPVDELLPVSMELRTEHRKLAVAMAIVMDRSGSMAASVASGVSKMDLGNEGAARAIDLLGPQDAISVLAVDSEPHTIIPLTHAWGRATCGLTTRCAASRAAVAASTTTSDSRPGGRNSIFHDSSTILLFADAAPTPEPGDYRTLVDEMVAKGATVSVIGPAPRPTRTLLDQLKDIAAHGARGRAFSADATALPGLVRAGSGGDGALGVHHGTDRGQAISGLAGTRRQAPALAARDRWTATTWATSNPTRRRRRDSMDEYASPLVAFWRGLGPATSRWVGEFSQQARAWPAYGDFLRRSGAG